MSNRTIDFAGHKMILHPSGSIFWPDQATLIVGDLHFEKASWYHNTGQFLPPYDSSETLKKLETVKSEFFPRRLILLGDVFHDNDAWHRMAQTDQEHLAKLLKGIETIYINGNHDQKAPRRAQPFIGKRKRLKKTNGEESSQNPKLLKSTRK